MAGTVTVTAKKEPCINTGFLKAGNETRTHDPFITSEVLYRLSYSSLCFTHK